MERNPDWAEPANNLAWLLAVSPDPRIRDPDEAVRLAERACAGDEANDHHYLDTLAAAYAAAGRFDESVEVCRRAIRLAGEAGDENTLAGLRRRLDFYTDRRPFRRDAPVLAAEAQEGRLGLGWRGGLVVSGFLAPLFEWQMADRTPGTWPNANLPRAPGSRG